MNHPVLRIPRTWFDFVLDAVAFAGVIACVATVIGAWNKLPEQIPHHFGFSGKPDAWGGKWMLVFLPAIAFVMYLGLTVLSRFPHKFNYWWPITEQNALQQCRVAVSMVGWLKVEIVWLFAFITWTVVRTALGRSEGLGSAFLPVVLGVVFGTIAVHLVLAYRSR